MTVMAPEMTLDVPNAVPIPKLTTRRQVLLAELANGKSMSEATATAKMQRESGYRAIDEMKERLPSIMDDLGLDVRSILCRIREKMDATETKFIPSPNGIHVRTVEAHGVQLKAIELAAKLRPELRPDASISVGTVNVLFAGALPDWTEPVGAGAGVGASPVTVHKGNSDSLVHSDSKADGPPPLSTLEGTGRESGGHAHTNSGNVDGDKCVNTPSVPVQAVPAVSVPATSVPAKSKLSSRVVKKRVARLPVFKGER